MQTELEWEPTILSQCQVKPITSLLRRYRG